MESYETAEEQRLRQERRRRLTTIIGAIVEDRHRDVLRAYGISEEASVVPEVVDDSVLRARRTRLALPPPDAPSAATFAAPRRPPTKRTLSR